MQEAAQAADVQRSIVNACCRRVEQARARVADAEVAIAEAKERERQAAIDGTLAEVRRLGEELDRDVGALADKGRLLLGAGARLVELLGPGLGWDCRLVLLSGYTLGKRLAKAVEWHIEPPDGRSR